MKRVVTKRRAIPRAHVLLGGGIHSKIMKTGGEMKAPVNDADLERLRKALAGVKIIRPMERSKIRF
jgi:hypothetical protein